MNEARMENAEGVGGASGAGDGHVRSAREILEEKLNTMKTEVPSAEQALKAAADRAPSGKLGHGGGHGTGHAPAHAAGHAGGHASGAGAEARAAGAEKQSPDLEKRVQDLEKERDALKGEALLARADMDNYQKRIRREMEEVRAYAAQGILADLLTALDNVDFSLAAAKMKPDLDQLVQGVEMVRTQIEKIYADRGAVRVPTDKVPFDPRRHEAILVEERDDVPDATVVQELRRGYAMKDRVIRAAQVKLSRAPAKPPAA